MTPKEIFEIAKHLSPADQAVWLHINQHEPGVMASREFVDWVQENCNRSYKAGEGWDVPGMAKFYKLTPEERELWKDAVIARAHRITLNTLQDLMQVKPKPKARKYIVTVPLTTWWGRHVWATSPEEAIELSIAGYDPDKHMPKYTKDIAFAFEGDKATVEDERTGQLVWPVDEEED